MLTIIKTLLQGENIILPRTRSTAVTMEDGTTVEYALKNVSTNNVKVSKELADAMGLVEGATLSSVLMTNVNSTANVLAAAEVVE